MEKIFEMISHYHKRIDQIKAKKENEIIKLLDTYKGNSRVGDRYIRLLFECALIYYELKNKKLEKVNEKAFCGHINIIKYKL